jgi:hypothetical protein
MAMSKLLQEFTEMLETLEQAQCLPDCKERRERLIASVIAAERAAIERLMGSVIAADWKTPEERERAQGLVWRLYGLNLALEQSQAHRATGEPECDAPVGIKMRGA